MTGYLLLFLFISIISFIGYRFYRAEVNYQMKTRPKPYLKYRRGYKRTHRIK